jgi:hypothetical protein
VIGGAGRTSCIVIAPPVAKFEWSSRPSSCAEKYYG